MANVYVITSISYPNNTGDPLVTIAGTVNGVQVSVSVWLSVFQQHAASAIAFQNWIQPLLLAAYNALQSTTVTPLISTFTV